MTTTITKTGRLFKKDEGPVDISVTLDLATIEGGIDPLVAIEEEFAAAVSEAEREDA